MSRHGSSRDAAKQDTLREAVRFHVDRGCTDPVEIMTSLKERYGEQWILREFLNIIRLLAAGRGSEIAPRGVGAGPRPPQQTRVQKAANGDPLGEMEWVGDHWVARRDMTAADCLTVARQYARLSGAALRHEIWWKDAARVIEREGAARLGEVRDLLPAPADRLALERGAA